MAVANLLSVGHTHSGRIALMSASLIRSASVILCLLAGIAPIATEAAGAKPVLSIENGFQQTVAVSAGSELSFGSPRQSPIRPGGTAAGEITISLAAGAAAGIAKLHVFERCTVPIGFTVTAWQGRKPIAVVKLCGHLARTCGRRSCCSPMTASKRAPYLPTRISAGAFRT
ncbi:MULTISPECIES: hypothetical protein [unclassified Bradyrhizobium]|uniref:hypothetical protein n=1 Tax=unclassified Bradyrhizobium TaxID=2631580 RepID=UPI001BACC094|nr:MULTISPECIES: hypothetical protein [unclassified Bradyrhizobium]MBR1202870.1 hypothetical protein [Bradyrhizobium sp. AUGA SZCCT0124]MBR1314284.1 hypothetical protein [Bradyrhizobium sp. AUGA SZCCT0051]MBR1342698.1 hypothetical protein [Bradyrhizobium sp. AUGA SZCCT0105]MBR1352927.1 hypothetical protein [Bradyrhizobium sp. AUGA SZCCT0045]